MDSPNLIYDEVCMRLSNQLGIAKPPFDYRVLTSTALAQRNQLYRAGDAILIRVDKGNWHAEIPVSFQTTRREPGKMARYVIDAVEWMMRKNEATTAE